MPSLPIARKVFTRLITQLVAALLLLTGAASTAMATEASPFGQTALSTGTAADIFPATATQSGATYRIRVAVTPAPAGDTGEATPATALPVIYLLDADAHFDLVVEMVKVLQGWGDLPPLVIVGVGYPVDSFFETIPLRLRDYAPVSDAPHEELVRKIMGAGVTVQGGGADAFAAFFEEDLKPLIAQRYPVDPADQALFGHSLGGLFGQHVLLTAPQMFQRYALLSPAVVWDFNEILKREAAVAAAGTFGNLPAEVFMGIGGDETTLAAVLALPPEMKEDEDRLLALYDHPNPVALAQQFAANLAARHYSGLALHPFRVFPHENHDSVVFVGYSSALRALYGHR